MSCRAGYFLERELRTIQHGKIFEKSFLTTQIKMWYSLQRLVNTNQKRETGWPGNHYFLPDS